MPVYEYACTDCKKVVSVLVRRLGEEAAPTCPECSGTNVHRLISRFAFHQSLMSRLDQLDPKYDKMVESSNPDLSFDSLVKRYKLDEPVTKRKE